MANRRFDRGYVIGERLVEIRGSFAALTGAGTVVAANVKGLGFGFAPSGTTGKMVLQPSARPGITSTTGILRTGTGLYTLIPDDSYRDCMYQNAHLAPATASGEALFAQVVAAVTGLATSATAPTFTIVLVNGSGTPTDAASASDRVNFHLTLSDSTERFVKP